MRILLPPSEAKTLGGAGASLAALGLGQPALAGARGRVLAAVEALSGESPERAAALLRLPPAVVEDAMRANREICRSPTRPALDRFSGVLYESFAPGALTPAARRTAEASVLIFDGAFGVLRGDEPVPDHRVPAAATLPGLGGVAALWRPVLDRALPDLVAGHLVVDLRSSDYAAMWRPAPGVVVPVRVLVAGGRAGDGSVRHTVQSVPSKVGKGVLARALCTSRRRLTTRRDLEAVARAAGFEVLRSAEAGLDLLFAFVPKGTGGR